MGPTWRARAGSPRPGVRNQIRKGRGAAIRGRGPARAKLRCARSDAGGGRIAVRLSLKCAGAASGGAPVEGKLAGSVFWPVSRSKSRQQWQSCSPPSKTGASFDSWLQQLFWIEQQFERSIAPMATRQIRACNTPGTKATAHNSAIANVRVHFAAESTPLLSIAAGELVNPRCRDR